MRCTRCDRMAVPQAVGQTPEGLVVFGWCLHCLEETRCRQVVIARRHRSVRHAWKRAREWRPSAPAPGRRGADELDDRRRLLGAFALILALWGLVLFASGLTLWVRQPPRPVSPLGNGTPSLLVAGGGSTAAVGLALWALISGHSSLRSRLALKAVQAASFAVAVGTLLAGIVLRSPRRHVWIVGIASAALTVSAAARWVEDRFHEPDRPRRRDRL